MSDDVCLRTIPVMNTIVTIHVLRHGAEETVERAFKWFRRIETCCTRFDAQSELRQLTLKTGVPVPVSPILYEAVQFAVAIAEESGGAFDPTVGHTMEALGFNREYRSGQTIQTPLECKDSASYRDIRLDPEQKTITLLRPLVLDLGAVAKGLAIDMAARELQSFEDFAIDAGGDLYLGGSSRDGSPWRVGIRHPRHDDELIDSIRVSDRAVCTSGDYERGPHILDPRTGVLTDSLASVTVVAPTAMLADALATAAFVLGAEKGIELFDRVGVDGLIFSPSLERHATQGMREMIAAREPPRVSH